MASPTGRRRSLRSPKPRGKKKRSASGPFASLFATLTSFSSSSSTSAAVTPVLSSSASPVSRTSKALPTTSNADEQPKALEMSRRRTSSKASLQPTPRLPDAGKPVAMKRQATPKQAPAKAKTPVAKTPTTPAASVARPNVFSFMSGEISTPPTPRPRGSNGKALAITSARPVERSVANGQIKSPTPRRPLIIPKSTIPLSSPSISDASSSQDDSSSAPDTPTPESQRLLMTSAKRSLERLKGQDAVGRSLRSEDFYNNSSKKVGRIPVTPPEAPMAPHLQAALQQSPQQHSGSFEYHYSPQSFNNYPNSPLMFAQSASVSLPYPTPPLDLQSPPTLGSSRSAPVVPQIQGIHAASLKEVSEVSSSTAISSSKESADTLPRQYRVLTQSTIHRTEAMIDSLEAELRTLDKSAPHWQREQLVMRLSNTLVMHHRLVDIWSKISQLSRLTMTKTEDRQKIEAAWSQLRQQYAHLSQVNGLGVDKFISNIVNDLVYIGEKAQASGKEQSERGRSEAQDLRIIMVLLGLIVVFLLLRDEMFQRLAIVAGFVIGVYSFLLNTKTKSDVGGGRQ